MADFSAYTDEELKNIASGQDLSAYSDEELKAIAMPSKSKSVQQKARSSVLDVAKGIVETPLAIATGMVAGLAGLGGSIGAGIIGESPEEAQKFREYVSEKYTYQPQSETGKGAMNILGTAMTPLALPRKAATELGGEQWGNVADVAMLGLLPKAPQAIRKIRQAPYEAGKVLYRKTLQPAGTTAETDAITKTGYEAGYGSTKAGMIKLQKDLGEVQRQANQILAKLKGETISMDKILKPLDDRIKQLQEVPTELPETHLRALERTKLQVTRSWLKSYPDGNIPVSKVQEFKVQLYDRARNAYGETQLAMSTEARKILARGARQELENLMPEIGVANRQMKPLLEFEEALDKSIVRIKNEKFSITNTIFNNDYLLGKLAKVFKAISPKHPLSNPTALKGYLYSTYFAGQRDVGTDEAIQRLQGESTLK